MIDGKKLVLVVEDDALLKMAAADLVTEAGYVALQASNADEALAILYARADIDLVFTDVEMPGTMNGLKLCQFIRERWPPVKLILVSGAAILAEHDLPEGSRFFGKPYHDHAIVKEMARMLAD